VSFRQVPTDDTAMKAFLTDLVDRLIRLENGGAIAGQVSFGPVIQIGDVLITITKGVGTHRNVVFKNVLSGTTSTIVL
jgi:hypothetical protein